MYLPIKVLETNGEGATESAVISVELRVGDQIRLNAQSAVGVEFKAFEVIGFEDGRNGRRALIRSPNGDKFHLEIGDSVNVWRSEEVNNDEERT